MITGDELRICKVFECLDATERDRLAAKAADIYVRPDEYLIREGETPHFYVMLEGTFKLSKETLGLERFYDEIRYESGDFFGEVPILLGSQSLVSLKAMSWCRVARFERQEFQQLIQDSEKCSAVIMQAMNTRLSKVQKYAMEMPSARVLVVGSQYDTDCRDIRTFLAMNRIPYEWIDRDSEPERVPVCMPKDLDGPAVVVDHAYCVEQPPTVRKVAQALGLRTHPTKPMYDVVIVGGGPAGLAAAVYGASEGLCVLLVERNAAGGQAGTSTRIENYLGFPNGVSGDELSEKALRQATRFGAEMVLTRTVVNVEAMTIDNGSEGYCVELDGGDRVQTRTVIMATGVDWRRLESKGVEELIGRGVLYGAARTESPTIVGKDVFIVGGGNSAGQAAMFFSSYARSVTMLVRGPKVEFTMSQYLVDQLAKKCNVSIETNSVVVEAHGEGHLEALTTQAKGEEPWKRKADGLFVMIGADANTSWLPKGLERDERGYICTGRDVVDLPGWDNRRRTPFLLETNLPGFFCAGDVRHDSIKRVSSGVGEGSMAIAFVHQYLALDDHARQSA